MTVCRPLPVLMLLGALAGCDGADLDNTERSDRLHKAHRWMYQLGGLEASAAVGALAATDYAMLVIEPGHNHRPCRDDFVPADYGLVIDSPDDACAEVYSTEAMLAELRPTPSGDERLLIAYIDIGQAEIYRNYWTKGWAQPSATEPGTPSFILTADPDGWAGNYVVAYWQDDWKDLWIAPDGIVPELARLGFDGVYLDWVEAYDDEAVQATASAQGVDVVDEMITFVEQIREAGRADSPGFLVIVQNATYLLDHADNPSRYADTIDALAVEDTWYFGNGSTEDWSAGADGGPYSISDRIACEQAACPGAITTPDNVCPDGATSAACAEQLPVSGDLHGGARHACAPSEAGTPNCWSTENRLAAYTRYRSRGVPVFTIDYCVSASKAAEVYAAARAADLRPLVTRVQLSNLTETPPPR